MGFSEYPPSEQWSALSFKGTRLADVWFKPDGDPQSLVFRVPRSTLQIPGIGPRLTPERLLQAVAVAAGEVESLHFANSASDPDDTALTSPLPPLLPDADHLEIRVRLKPPPEPEPPEPVGEVEPAAPEGNEGADPPSAVVSWDDLVAVWRAIVAIEATVEAVRKNVEGARAEVEAASRKTLMGDEKVHALSGDIANWTRAKGRAHFVVPKANDFVHRATWASGATERKRLGEIFENTDPAAVPPPPSEQLLHELESLRKNRQVLSAQGTAVYQECRAILADVNGALRTLQSNAASRASKKKGGTGGKGRSF